MRVYDVTIPSDFQPSDLKMISQKASRFISDITIEFHENHGGRSIIDVKSLLGMMLLPIYKGTKITVKTKGTDEKEAIDFMSDLLEGFKAGSSQ